MRCLTLFLLVMTLAWQAPALASPPAQPDVPEAVDAYLVYPASREPDAQGNFEIEVYCGANHPIEEIVLYLGRSGEIALQPPEGIQAVDERTLLLFMGRLERGETRVWRMKGGIARNATDDEEAFPASLVLYVDYRYPYQAVARHIEQTLAPGQERDELLRDIESGDERRNLVKALPIGRGMRLR